MYRFYGALAASLLVGISAPALQAQAASPLITKAKALIASRMADPSSLQYRNVRVVRQTIDGKALTIVCGEYNAKNRMGGYVGFATFAYEVTILEGVFSIGSDLDYFRTDGADYGAPNINSSLNARILHVCVKPPE